MLGASGLRARRAMKRARQEDVDPMNSLGNLADAMLVMSVGLMIALISAWQLDMNDIIPQVEVAENSSEVEAEEDQSLEDLGLSEYGRVFVDRDGNFYMVEES